MLICWTLLWFLATVCTCTSPPCDDAIKLPELQRRGGQHELTDSEPMVNDIILDSKWYAAKDAIGLYKMTDATSMPSPYGCGTLNQIYIQGTHPNVTSEIPVSATVCVMTIDDNCEKQYQIQIRNCNNTLQYHLLTTQRYEAFCFDLVSIQAGNNITIQVPGVPQVKPVLVWKPHNRMVNRNRTITIQKPSLIFNCSFGTTDGAWYTVSWYVNGLHFVTSGPTQDVDSLYLHTEKLFEKGYHLGLDLKCGVQASMEKTGTRTLTHYSNEFFAGVKVSEPKLTVKTSETSKDILLTITVPLGCEHDSLHVNVCNYKKLDVHMVTPNYTCGNDKLVFSRCNVGLDLQTPSSKWDPDTVYRFHVTLMKDYIDIRTYNLYLETNSLSTHDDFFKGQRLNIIVEVTNDTPTVQKCHAHVDPHFLTADQDTYDCHLRGTFVLYRNIVYNIEVQHITRSCNNYRATCSCAIAIRAGADVFVIDRCSDRNNFNEFLLCDDGGILNVVMENDYLYTVYTPIGTKIVISINPGGSGWTTGFMNIDIYLSPKDWENTAGLCGTYDGNKNNDLQKRNGNQTLVNDKINEFCNDWRVTVTENLFNSSNYDVGNSWTSKNDPICVCSQSFPFLNPSEHPQNVNTATCGKTNFTNCFKRSSITDRKCAKIVQNGRMKRSLSLKNNNLQLLKVNKRQHERLARHAEQEEMRSLPVYTLTKEDARGNCTRIINNSAAVHSFPDTVGAVILNNTINDCVFDVITVNDLSVASVQADSLNTFVAQMLRYDPKFVEDNAEKVKEFMKQTCLNNCSNEGYCTDQGTCACNNQYHGPDCSVFEGDPIDVSFVYDEGACNTAGGDDCTCFWFYTKNLLPNFKCKFTRSEFDSQGNTSFIDEHMVQGHYDDMLSGQCCVAARRRKRSPKTAILGYKYDLTISNDGAKFGAGDTFFVVNGDCLDIVSSESTGDRKIILKPGNCLIDGQCFPDLEYKISDPCKACNTAIDRFSWHDVCKTNHSKADGIDEVDQVEEGEKANADMTVVAVVVPMVIVVIVILTIAAIYCYKSSCMNKKKVGSDAAPNVNVNIHCNANRGFNIKQHSLYAADTACWKVTPPRYHNDGNNALQDAKDKDTPSRPESATTVRGVGFDFGTLDK